MKRFAVTLLVLLAGCNHVGNDVPVHDSNTATDDTAATGDHHLQSVDDTNFAATVLKSNLPVMVDFWAPWCGPCRQLTPVVEELAADFEGRATIVKLNVDEAPAMAREYEVTAIPLLLFFNDGEVVKKLTGFQSKETLTGILESFE